MPSTVKYALNYPSGTTAPNVPVSMQTSMESVEAALTTLATEKHAKGLVYQNIVTTSSSSVVDNIISNIPTFTFKANRKYRVVWDFSYFGSGNSDSLFYCSVNWAPVGDAMGLLTSLTLMHGRTKGFYTAYALQSSQQTGPVVCYYNPTADLTTQIKFRAQRVVGDDGMTISANANEPAVYSVYDDGAQY